MSYFFKHTAPIVIFVDLYPKEISSSDWKKWGYPLDIQVLAAHRLKRETDIKTSKRNPQYSSYFLLPQNLFPQIWQLTRLEYITHSPYFSHAPHILTSFISVGFVMTSATSLTSYWCAYIDFRLNLPPLRWYWCLQLHKQHDMQRVAIQ